MTKKSKSAFPEHDQQADNILVSSKPMRKKFFSMFRSDKSEAHATPLAGQPERKIHNKGFVSINAGNGQIGVVCAISSLETDTQPTVEEAKVRLDIFSTNVARPTVQTPVPKFGTRIDSTPQLALCSSLLPRSAALSLSNEPNLGISLPHAKGASQDTPSDDATRNWVKAIEQSPTEQSHIRWLLERMVEEFVKDPTKGSATVTEVVLLGPVLDYEHYRKLLNCFIQEFQKATILDDDLLHGLIQLVQCNSKGYLIADDLIKILSILRIRLQQTDQRISKHPYHLTLAVSRLLDVMAKHEVKDLDRVEEHEPLGAVLSCLQGSSDPFLIYQASYAFQALQYVPSNETVLQAIVRQSGIVAESLIGISGVLNLNVSGFLESLGQLQKAVVETIGIAKSAIEGAQSLIESGKGVFEAMKEAVSSGNRRAWYPAIVGATALVQEGRLADFRTVVMEAPCRVDPKFQWGICQLLGEIAVDSTWDSAIRREAVDFLAGLYANDPNWGKDASVKAWILNILCIVSEGPEQSIHGPHVAAILQKDVNKVGTAQCASGYPLRSRLPVPVASPLLARVQKIPPVERELNQLRAKRLRNRNPKVYIPPQAKASLRASNKDSRPLVDLIMEFLDSDRQVFLVLGDSGAGKSTFNRYLENKLWKEYSVGGRIPLFINLPVVSENHRDIVGEQLRTHKFLDAMIRELKDHREMVLICDGYDEAQLRTNLHTANKFNHEGQPNIKMIVSCRSTYLGQDYHNLFRPQTDWYGDDVASLYTEAVIVPFSSGQIEDYVDQLVRDPEVHKLMGTSRVWSTEDYMIKLRSIPNMMDLVKNPFLLSLSLQALPLVVQDGVDLAMVKVTRLTLYNSFVDQWLDINKHRLENITRSVERAQALQELLEEGFAPYAIGFLMDLAAAIFKEQRGNPVVQFTPISDKGTWKSKYFGPEPRTVLLRESSPLSRTGTEYRFLHRSLLEYFYSRHIHETHRLMSEVALDIADHPLGQTNLVQESSIIDFLAEHAQGDLAFKQLLHHLIELSKTYDTAIQAAANAITTLVRVGVTFNGADLRGIQIPGADLSGGEFDSAQLQGADLSDTNLRGIWLRQADLSNAQMAGAAFGEWPFLVEKDEVMSSAYSPDGNTLAIGLEHGTIQLYTTATWDRTRTLKGHTSDVNSVVFSTKSQKIASGSRDRTVRIWDAQSGTTGVILCGHTEAVWSVAFSPDGQQIASGSGDSTVRLWDAQSGAPGAILSGHTFPVMSVVFSPSGQQIASGSGDKTVRIWNALSGAPGVVLSGHFSAVLSVVFSPNGQQIASGSLDSRVRLWDAQSGAPGVILCGHTQAVCSVVFSPNGEQIASGSSDNTVRLWDAHSGTPGVILSGHTSPVLSVAYEPNGLQIASGSRDKTVRLWNAICGAPGDIEGGHTEAVRSVVFSPNGLQIASSSGDKTVRLWNALSGTSSGILSGHTASVRSVAFSPSGRQIASGSRDKTVRLWDAQSGAARTVLSGHTDHVKSVAFSPSGLQIVSGSDDKTVRLWDAQSGAPGFVLSGHTDYVTSVTFSPNGQRIASGNDDRTVRLWDAQSGASGVILIGHTNCVESVAFSPNGEQIASGSDDKTVRLWDAQSGAPGVILSGHTHYVWSVAFSPDGQQIASASEDNTVRLWDVESGQSMAVIKDFYSEVSAIAWKAIGSDSYIASGSSDKSVRLWKVTSDCHFVCLQWSSGHDRLAVADANISAVRGLSRVNMELLKQRGASRSSATTGRAPAR